MAEVFRATPGNFGLHPKNNVIWQTLVNIELHGLSYSSLHNRIQQNPPANVDVFVGMRDTNT